MPRHGAEKECGEFAYLAAVESRLLKDGAGGLSHLGRGRLKTGWPPRKSCRAWSPRSPPTHPMIGPKEVPEAGSDLDRDKT